MKPHCIHRLAGLGSLGLLLLWSASPLDAQLAHASASTLALAGNHTASARGFGAISVNPAGLGMPGSGFSLVLPTPQARLGFDPIQLGDLVDFEGQLVPVATKEEWLTRVIEAGGQGGTVGADVSAFALTVGSFGLQVSTVASADVIVPPGVVEAALFGNAGRTGSPTDLSLAGASVEGFATSTVGASYGFSVSPMLTLGVTGTYTLGHALAVGRSDSGLLEADPIRGTVDAPVVTSCSDEIACVQDFFNGGSGLGLDVGAIATLERFTVAASIQNLFNTFSWDEDKLGFRQMTLLFDEGEVTSTSDEVDFSAAPEDVKSVVRDFTFKPSFRLGAALDLNPNLTLTGDIHGRFNDEALAIGPRYHTGVGAELRLGVVQLRAGAAKVTDGIQLGGGGSLVLGPVNLSAAGGVRTGDLGDTVLGQFTLSFGNR